MNHMQWQLTFVCVELKSRLAHDGFLILLLLIREREKAAFLGFFADERGVHSM